MTETPRLTPEVAVAGRRAVQMLRCYRRRDVAGMNALLGECADGSATHVLTMLLGWTSDLLNRFPPEAIDQMLCNLAIDFGLEEQRPS